jgi:hypothetical protein
MTQEWKYSPIPLQYEENFGFIQKKKMPPKDLSPLEGNIHALLGLYFIDTNRG